MTHPPAASKAKRKADDRDRKRRDREEMRQAGIPDQRMLDAAIVDALRDAILDQGGIHAPAEMALFKEILKRSAETLRDRRQKGIPLNRANMHSAIANRLIPMPD
ncbi:hypothetical protein [Methylobacterium frigidaeris]|nr:hypothetical protein [Methylobacterium frigidaeris]